MNAVLKKMFYKGQSPTLLLHAPPEFKKVAADFEGPVHSSPKAVYPFALAFAENMAVAEKIGKNIGKFLDENSVFWMAYPKGTSKKHKGADINRDSAHALLAKHGLDGVSLVAIDDDWSALRFKFKP